MAGSGLDSLPNTKCANDDLLTTLSAFGKVSPLPSLIEKLSVMSHIFKGHPKLSESTKNEIAVLIEQRETGWPSKVFICSVC